jgi:hypothetical protein
LLTSGDGFIALTTEDQLVEAAQPIYLLTDGSVGRRISALVPHGR